MTHYQANNRIDFLRGFQRLKKKHRKAGLLFRLSLLTGIIGLALILLSFAPSVWYEIASGGPQKVSRFLASTAGKGNALGKIGTKIKRSTYQPVLNPQLSKESKLKIPSVKIDTKINEANLDSYENALKIGVWRAPDFGTPDNREKPVILAAHRFGYLKWSVAYRLKNSFYNLPKLKVGELVEIDWNQRKYLYEVYAEGKGEEITDYSADLILYTCEALNSSVRIFKYARLLEI